MAEPVANLAPSAWVVATPLWIAVTFYYAGAVIWLHERRKRRKMSITLHWVGKTAHTRCKAVKRSRFKTSVPLWAFNIMWWDEVICRECVPEPVLSEAAADKVPWPWRNPK